MNGVIYLVATPIGNLEDITYRAIKVLKDVDFIAAEDTRHTLKLLNHFEIQKPLISYYKQNEKVKSEIIIKKVLEGKNVAIVSDAGTPGISDPGSEIVSVAIENNIKVIPIPGACALINALICSGMDTSSFSFYGFLPVNLKEKKEKLEAIKDDTNTLIFYEAPHKLNKTLNDLYDVFGDREIVLARELTKIHEEFKKDMLSNLIKNEISTKGEYVLIIEGNRKNKKEIQKEKLNELSLEEHYKYYESQNMDKKEIIKHIARDRNVSKNEIYMKFL